MIYINQNKFDLAKQSYQQAVTLDIKNTTAFDQLISNGLMSPDEGT